MFQVQENLRTRASKSGTPQKVVILQLLASLSWKRLQICIGMLPITTSTSDELFSRIDDSERPWTSKIRGFIDFCDLWLQRTLQEWTVTKWLEIDWQFTNRNCYRLLCVSWALAQISCSSTYGITKCGIWKFHIIADSSIENHRFTADHLNFTSKANVKQCK